MDRIALAEAIAANDLAISRDFWRKAGFALWAGATKANKHATRRSAEGNILSRTPKLYNAAWRRRWLLTRFIVPSIVLVVSFGVINVYFAVSPAPSWSKLALPAYALGVTCIVVTLTLNWRKPTEDRRLGCVRHLRVCAVRAVQRNPSETHVGKGDSNTKPQQDALSLRAAAVIEARRQHWLSVPGSARVLDSLIPNTVNSVGVQYGVTLVFVVYLGFMLFAAHVFRLGGGAAIIPVCLVMALLIPNVVRRTTRNADKAQLSRACPDCGFSLAGMPALVMTNPINPAETIDAGPAKCPECGTHYPLVPPPTPDEIVEYQRSGRES